MSPLWIIPMFVGPFVIVTVVLVVVFSLIRRAIDRDAAALASEGIELDSGRVTITTRYRDFRAPGIYRRHALKRIPSRLVLTKSRFHVLARPRGYGIVDRSALDRFTVGILDGKLHLRATDPPGASGSIDIRVAVPDPEAWVTALRAAGARAA